MLSSSFKNRENGVEVFQQKFLRLPGCGTGISVTVVLLISSCEKEAQQDDEESRASCHAQLFDAQGTAGMASALRGMVTFGIFAFVPVAFLLIGVSEICTFISYIEGVFLAWAIYISAGEFFLGIVVFCCHNKRSGG